MDTTYSANGQADCHTLDAELLSRSQYPEGAATGHLDTGFSCFPLSTSEC